MPVNKNALIRYKTIDRCLRNKYRRWTLDDLVEACSDALYEMEGITRGVSVRTVQADIQVMRSDKLGYEAPIEVYYGRFTVSCNSRYATPQCWRTQKDSYSGNRLAFGIIQARLSSALSCGDFELSEPFERLGPLAEGWFLSPKAASR